MAKQFFIELEDLFIHFDRNGIQKNADWKKIFRICEWLYGIEYPGLKERIYIAYTRGDRKAIFQNKNGGSPFFVVRCQPLLPTIEFWYKNNKLPTFANWNDNKQLWAYVSGGNLKELSETEIKHEVLKSYQRRYR